MILQYHTANEGVAKGRELLGDAYSHDQHNKKRIKDFLPSVLQPELTDWT